LGVAVRFTGRVSRAEVLAAMRGATVVVFTGMREEGGLALGEALLMGCPVIVLDNGGARFLAGRAADGDRVSRVPVTTRDGTLLAMATAIADHCATPRTSRSPLIDQAAERRELERLVRLAIPGSTDAG
jgi:glycosyltransferase involved in cell wall biosynthesis